MSDIDLDDIDVLNRIALAGARDIADAYLRHVAHPHAGYSCDGCADRLAALCDLFREPHHLGFPVSGRTGTYDRNAVMVKRDWYERLRAALADAP